VAFEIHFIPLIISILLSIAELFLKAGLRERGMELLNFARTFPSSDQLTRRLAGEKLAQYNSQHETDNETQPSSSPENLDAVVNTLLLEAEGLAIDTQNSPPAQVPPQTRHLEKSVYEVEQKIFELLTEREIQILRYMNEGLSNQSIAEQLILSLGTVKWYTSQIYGKLQITSRTQAIAKARELGIL
jgi:ATP/maltotriose-dependent transcriptional regulator MalT